MLDRGGSRWIPEWPAIRKVGRRHRLILGGQGDLPAANTLWEGFRTSEATFFDCSTCSDNWQPVDIEDLSLELQPGRGRHRCVPTGGQLARRFLVYNESVGVGAWLGPWTLQLDGGPVSILNSMSNPCVVAVVPGRCPLVAPRSLLVYYSS